MTRPDTRLNAYRADLADEKLREQVEADRFVPGRPYTVAAGRLSLREAPAPDARQGSELLYGENVDVFEISEGWAWLQNHADGYVGYADAERLTLDHREPTHSLGALRSFIFSEPDLKSPVLDSLSMNAALTADGQEDGFLGLAGGGWVWAGHAVKPDMFEADHAAVALRFLNAPYLWGGRTSLGLDCSALVQLALARCGMDAPRDSDMQAEGIGEAVMFDGDESILRRGDLVFWPGHVGIWLAPDSFVHANATRMMTTDEPFAVVAKHIREATGDDVSAVRRPR